MERIDVPVLIVGAGPTGLSAALLLRRLGIDSLLVERRPGPQRAPAAHCINARTFEIWRQAGANLAAIAAATRDPADAGFVYFVTVLGGEILGRLPYERQGEDALAVTPTPLRNLSQHRLEPILVDSLVAAGAPPPRYGQERCRADSPVLVLARRKTCTSTGTEMKVGCGRHRPFLRPFPVLTRRPTVS